MDLTIHFEDLIHKNIAENCFSKLIIKTHKVNREFIFVPKF